MVGFSATASSLQEASNSFPTFTSPANVKYDHCGGKRRKRKRTKKKSMKKRRRKKTMKRRNKRKTKRRRKKTMKRRNKRKTKRRRKKRRSRKIKQVGRQRGGSKLDMSSSYSTTPSANLEMPWALGPGNFTKINPC